MTDYNQMIDNLPNKFPTKERVVIFAEGNADDVYFKDGYPIVKKDRSQSHFANSARDFAKANPQYEYLIVTGSGENQLNKAFQDVKNSGFVNENTRLMVMGHASSQGNFASVDPAVWGKAIRDNGLRNSFKEVAYGACGQGEFGVCVDLSRVFGDNTTVYAQVGQTWGVADTPNMYLNRLESEGGTSELHKRPKTFQDAFRTVGSGYMTFQGADRTFTPGSTVTENPYSGEFQNKDMYLSEEMPQELFNTYKSQMDSIKAQYDYPEFPNLKDPKYARQGKRRYNHYEIKNKVWHDAKQEFLMEKYPDRPLPKNKGSVEFPNIQLSRRDYYDFLDWIDDKEANVEDAQMIFDYIEEGGSRMLHGNTTEIGTDWIATEVAKRQLLQHIEFENPTEETALIRQEDEERSRRFVEDSRKVGQIHKDLNQKAESEAIAAGITMPETIKSDHLLDSDEVIDFPTLEEMLDNPDVSLNLHYDNKDLDKRIEGFKELYMQGNKEAEKALKSALKNMDNQDEINQWENPHEWYRLLNIEALKVYAQSNE